MSKVKQVSHTVAARVDPIIVSGGSIKVDLPDAFGDEPPSGNYKHFKDDKSNLVCVQVSDKNGNPLLTYNVPDSKCVVTIWLTE
jgi:hypothetical protein